MIWFVSKMLYVTNYAKVLKKIRLQIAFSFNHQTQEKKFNVKSEMKTKFYKIILHTIPVSLKNYKEILMYPPTYWSTIVKRNIWQFTSNKLSEIGMIKDYFLNVLQEIKTTK